MYFKCLKKVISLNYCMVSMCLFPLCLHPKGEVQSVINPQAFEAARGSQIYRICFLVRRLKYQSTFVRPLPRILGKLASCIILDKGWLIYEISRDLGLSLDKCSAGLLITCP